ncbi:MAG TPA: hypothetical protein VFW16_11465 [Streptosporangiaceae bacterium]|nr:hypothetical protein [Streptosporangiaceae bacterium]
MSSRSAKHRKSKRPAARQSAPARHRKPSPVVTALQIHPGKTAAAVTGAVIIAAAAPIATHWAGDVGVGQAAVLSHGNDGTLIGGSQTPSAGHDRDASSAASHPQAGSPAKTGTPKASSPGPSPTARQTRKHEAPHAVYENPLRDVSGLIPERIDQGVDFGGTGPIYALGDAVITNATATNYGWPGGGWITYQLTDGPAKGLMVFLAEDVRPTVSPGQHVTAGTVIAGMYDGGAGIEFGWAMASGFTAESQLAEAGGISGAGPFPTNVGLNFEELLQATGVPAANNRYDIPSGLLPPQFPASWETALKS